MNREILFRGKRVDNSEWVTGDIIQYEDFPRIGCYCASIEGKPCYEHTITRSTIGQYTGLKDKNDKMIFEGDALSSTKQDWIGIVKYQPGGWYCHIPSSIKGVPFMEQNQPLASFVFDHHEWTVFGNIHDNPELLKATS